MISNLIWTEIFMKQQNMSNCQAVAEQSYNLYIILATYGIVHTAQLMVSNESP